MPEHHDSKAHAAFVRAYNRVTDYLFDSPHVDVDSVGASLYDDPEFADVCRDYADAYDRKFNVIRYRWADPDIHVSVDTLPLARAHWGRDSFRNAPDREFLGDYDHLAAQPPGDGHG